MEPFWIKIPGAGPNGIHAKGLSPAPSILHQRPDPTP